MQKQQPTPNKKTFTDVIAWVRTNKPEKVAEFLHYILCKGIELGMNTEYEDWDTTFDALCAEYNGTPLFVEMLCDQIENANEPFTPGVVSPFKALIS